MARTVGIGHQDFEKIRKSNIFYIDKTDFIKEWWEAEDAVTLITRPRRFGKTLNINMLEKFFSVEYADRGELFEGLSIWREEKYRQLQGSYPVISLSFAKVKETSFSNAKKMMCHIIKMLYGDHDFVFSSEKLNGEEKAFYHKVSAEMEDYVAADSLNMLSRCVMKYYGKKVIILLDEYDTPMQEAYINGYWEEMVAFTRSLFNSTFKTNPYLERALMTGITRVSRESIFSDLNNLEVVTTTSEKYAESFGFTEEEVFSSLDEFALSERKQDVKKWYDGFTFGKHTDIYNPWSILNFLDKKRMGVYWANSSSNSLVGKLVREGNKEIKQSLEDLLQGGILRVEIDEQIVYGELHTKRNAVWSLLLASGYLKVLQTDYVETEGVWYYSLALTNREVRVMFGSMIRGWFSEGDENYNDFIKALLSGDLKAMNYYMNKVALTTFSSFRKGNEPKSSSLDLGDCLRVSGEAADFDSGNKPSEAAEPERFYHGFVLGLLVELAGRYSVTSNRESGFGRYDVMLEPKSVSGAEPPVREGDAVILEFKVQDSEEKDLSDTVKAALQQIEEKKYETTLIGKGIPRERIRKYGFAFRGKEVLIGCADG